MGDVGLFVAALGVVLAADVISKLAVRRLAPCGLGHRSLGLRGTVNVRGNVAGLSVRLALGVLGATLAVGLVLAATAGPPPTVFVGLGAALGGAVGNLLDRRTHGGVLDFVVIGRWPPFNVADVALVGGAVLVMVGVLT